jgi:phage-related tail protein
MAVTKNEMIEYGVNRDKIRYKPMKAKKIYNKLREAFNKLNNKVCYAYIDDKENKTYQNALDFFTLLEKALENEYGKKKKYKKSEVYDLLQRAFYDLTERGCKTMKALHKALKKNKSGCFEGFKFKGLMKGGEFEAEYNSSDDVDDYIYDSFDR